VSLFVQDLDEDRLASLVDKRVRERMNRGVGQILIHVRNLSRCCLNYPPDGKGVGGFARSDYLKTDFTAENAEVAETETVPKGFSPRSPRALR
jgi:hypothetical protein